VSAAPSRRWLVLGVFVLSTAINYLDRQSLATVAPLVRAEFHLTNADYGLIVTAFSLMYALSAPLMGFLIDWLELNRGITLAVGIWSLAGIATGLTRGFGGLLGCRAVLGLAEAGGIPAAGKAIHRYLKPQERALGNAVNQVAVSLGLIAAPPLATWLAVSYGWRTAFIATGLLGLIWIPVWLRIAAAPAPPSMRPAAASGLVLLGDKRLWGFVAANALSMVLYSLWTNWTTLYLVDARGLTLVQAAWFAWIPPLFASMGGLAGGWLSMRWMAGGMNALPARRRACGACAVAALATAAIPLLSSPWWAAAGISLSFFFVSGFSVNMYTMPLDAYGGERAAFAVSLLVCSYGLMQALVSPAFGAVIDRYGYSPVIVACASTPLAAYGVLILTERPR
jgi:ACS family hexuronate transporter-like MFS transporter